jgi:alkaline phosphatase D
MGVSIVARRCCSALLLLLFSGPGLVSAADSKKPLVRIAFGSCAQQDRPQPIWEAIVGTKPDLFLFIGDTVYGDTEDMKVLRAEYAKLAAMPGYQKLKKTCPILATWDDHDYGVNDGGAEYPRKKESQQIFLDFFDVPRDSPRRKQEGVYHAAVLGPVGKRVQIILLDTRYFRSPLKRRKGRARSEGPYVANTDPKSTILGEVQWKWLGEQLKVPAEVRLLISSIQVVAEDHGWEKWMNFPHERARLYKLLRDSKAGGVIILSGDRHLAELSMMEADIGYPIYDLTSSGLNQGFQRWRRLEKNQHRVATMNTGNNFGLIRIDWDRKDPRVCLQIRDEEGEITIQEKVALSTLQPGWVGPNLASQALPHLGKDHTVEMVVRAVGANRAKTLVFLNSESDYRSPRNLTVVLDMKAVGAGLKKAGITDARKHFSGKKVRVTGKVSLYQKQVQIMVKDPKQIRVIEPR